MLLTGVCTSYVIMHKIRVQVFKDYEKSSVTALQALYHHLERGDFEPGDKRLASKAFANVVAENGLANHFAYVKIWRKDGTVIYSNAVRLSGKKRK